MFSRTHVSEFIFVCSIAEETLHHVFVMIHHSVP